MARRKSFTQSYTTNNIGYSSITSGRVGQTSARGRFTGAAQGLQTESGGKLSAGGKLLSHRQKYRQVRIGLGLSGG